MKLKSLILAALLAVITPTVFAHGDVTPQPVDTTGLKDLGKDWNKTNPYRGDQAAAKIGASGYNQNCARCHGLQAISGGLAPDLRQLPLKDEGDGYFVEAVRKGRSRDGRIYMPPFEGVLSQEALWAIRTWLETVHEN